MHLQEKVTKLVEWLQLDLAELSQVGSSLPYFQLADDGVLATIRC
jgi:hypothetical protein